MNPVRRLRCCLGGHKITLFPKDGLDRLVYTCPCQKLRMSRELREHTIDEMLARFRFDDPVGAA